MQLARSGMVLSVLLALAACSIVSSEKTDLSQSVERSGVLYMLPKAMVQIQVTDNAGNLSATLFNPILAGDDQASYLLSYDASILSSDKVKIDVDPKTSLLQLVDATAEDKTAEIIKKLAQTAALIAQSGEAGGEAVLYNKMFDPATDQGIVNDEVNTAIKEYLAEKTADCAGVAATDKPCQRYKSLQDKISVAGSTPLFNLAIQAAFVMPAANGQAAVTSPPADATDCTIGICYRPVMPYQIEAKLGYRLSSVTVFLPNKAPAIALPLDRFLMVTSTHKITLKDGLLSSVETTKPSEALAVASLPLDVMEAIIASLTNFAKLGTGLENAKTALLKAQLDAQKQAVENDKFKPQSAVLGGSGSILLQVTTGSNTDTLLPDAPHDQVTPNPAPAPDNGGSTTPPGKGSGTGN